MEKEKETEKEKYNELENNFFLTKIIDVYSTHVFTLYERVSIESATQL